MKRMVVVLFAVLAATTAELPANAASPPPAPASSPTPILQTNLFDVSASTDQATGAVNYSAQDDQSTVTGGGRSTRSTGCVGESPAQANIEFLAQGMTLRPLGADGQPLSFVGSVPQNISGDPNVPGYNSLTQSNAVEYIVVCNGVPTGYGMFVPSISVGTPAQIKSVAQSAAGSIPMPNVTIDTSPQTAGLVHLNTWFWATGYAGGPIVQTRNALGVSIEVDAVPTSFTWTFGDGSVPLQTDSLGVAWTPAFTPAKSTVDCNFDGTPVNNGEPVVSAAITHCYTQTSPGFAVTLTFDLAVSFRVNGGAATPLPPIHRTATLTYPVDEINTVITSR